MPTANTEEENSKSELQKNHGGGGGFTRWAVVAVIFRLALIYFPGNLNLSSRPEVSTPLTSIRRLAEGYWLKQSSMSPYAGSMYHGSPLLLSVLGPLTVKRIEGQPSHILCSLVFVLADLISSILIRATGRKLQIAYRKSLKSLNLLNKSTDSGALSSGDIAALVYLWNPFTIVACVGLSTSPVENLFTILTLYGAATGLAPLAAFGWVMATHLSLYPAILIIPVNLSYSGSWFYPPAPLSPEYTYAPPSKLFRSKEHGKVGDGKSSQEIIFSWRRVFHLLVWTSLWSVYVLVLCSISVKQHGSLQEMFQRTYGFILTVEDLSPNIGVLWYFFAEVFDFFRDFFLIVFHSNILFMILPLAIRLKHRPCFLAFVYIAISSMLKSYPSVSNPYYV
ncbi:unnamed protein product [Linum tenue]|uniref:GPI transamidase subunit PIG-U n=1 Tax=Linum tenue TaxID=586396 RepID=A0AAV0JYX1_9ROSI|nr:unnamed protein product [Linum tenue]